jgi:hypothetical protein
MSTKNGANKNLDFYESLYHFKKMFPKIDTDIIESVLRGNNGSVDRTLDYLLSMEIVNEDEMLNDKAVKTSNKFDQFDTNVYDAPPLYHELPQSIRDGYLQRSNSFRSELTVQSISYSENVDKFKIPIKSLLNSAFIGNLPDDFLRVQPTTTQLNTIPLDFSENESEHSVSHFLLFTDFFTEKRFS